MSRNSEEQLVYEFDSIKSGLSFRGHDPNILQIVWSIRSAVKEFYYINKAPEELVKALEDLEEKFKTAEQSLFEVADLISKRIQKDEGMVNGRYP